ncbi:MAG: hypothetical protein ACQUHE_17600, partial [Bacteroidia bacterium]
MLKQSGTEKPGHDYNGYLWNSLKETSCGKQSYLMRNVLVILIFSICSFSCNQKNHLKTNQALIDSVQANKKYIKQAIAFIQIVNQNKPVSLSTHVALLEFLSCIEQLKWDTVTFTKSELAYITKQSQNPPIKRWTRELIPKARLIDGDTITNIFNNYAKMWPYFNKEIGRDFTSFSAPIFLRNNQYCIFYS